MLNKSYRRYKQDGRQNDTRQTSTHTCACFFAATCDPQAQLFHAKPYDNKSRGERRKPTDRNKNKPKGGTQEAHGPEKIIKQDPKARNNHQKLGAICNCNNHAKDEGA